ncbi:UDP-glucose ceramide glucosyltransferase [Taphrina deformans PYCC 5710]|uniref:Ceramide glucosyltransferase n=1 Tax=Taphrina deformans (strain PYCC 5710 / ATCC 11124 / CBS 356.35 / IMI 108563 / JCM 9778 / NBRC 8474) TaxID=1097556 RepID=R4XGC1_TAPDE|nr:UDP-glucose ceramide glucosyltransferase [Taphrina deformans PYCC 5710]|eukprot:CCG83539.1 UDP-glucose ceramide glucosyltransferase [Taphrina deformans PYCC 5710]
MSYVDLAAKVGLAWYLSIGLVSVGGWLCVLAVYNRSSPRQRSSNVRAANGASDVTESAALAYDRPLGVSILRPMSGLDPDLQACLVSSFTQNYRPFEVILSVKSAADPAIQIAKRVMSEYPDVDSTLIVGDVEIGVNPKINNLIKSFERSNWTSPLTLSRSMRHFEDTRVNLVHHIPIAHAAINAKAGAMLDDVYMGTMHAKMYSIINFLCVAPCVMGKSNILRKSALPEDGLKSFGKFIAEDHLLAVDIWRGRGNLCLTCLAHSTV